MWVQAGALAKAHPNEMLWAVSARKLVTQKVATEGDEFAEIDRLMDQLQATV
jgi:hypothetical protein